MIWELREVKDIEATLDDSGVYVVINRVVTERTFKDIVGDVVRVRADLMARVEADTANKVVAADTDEPIVSFIGDANAVRKHLIAYIEQHCCPPFSHEHASYIGYELLRAETDPHYVQD